MSRAATCDVRDAPHVQDCGAVHFLAGKLVWSSIVKLFVVVRHIVNSDIARFCGQSTERTPTAERKRNQQRRQRGRAQEFPPADLLSFRPPLVLTGHLLSLRSLRASMSSGIGDRGGERRECSSPWLRWFPQPRRTRGAAKWGLENRRLPAHSQNTSSPPCLLPVDSSSPPNPSPFSPIENLWRRPSSGEASPNSLRSSSRPLRLRPRHDAGRSRSQPT